LINALAINFAQALKNNCVCLGKIDRQGVKQVEPTPTNFDELSWGRTRRRMT